MPEGNTLLQCKDFAAKFWLPIEYQHGKEAGWHLKTWNCTSYWSLEAVKWLKRSTPDKSSSIATGVTQSSSLGFVVNLSPSRIWPTESWIKFLYICELFMLYEKSIPFIAHLIYDRWKEYFSILQGQSRGALNDERCSSFWVEEKFQGRKKKSVI